MTVVDEEVPKLYYTVGEVVDKLSISPSSLREWETYFGLDVRRSRNKSRLFTSKEFETMQQIYYLLYVEKYTKSGAREKLKELRTNPTVAVNDSLLGGYANKKLEWYKRELMEQLVLRRKNWSSQIPDNEARDTLALVKARAHFDEINSIINLITNHEGSNRD